MAKTQAEKDAAKQAAKAAVAERKAVHAAALDTPIDGGNAETQGVDTAQVATDGQGADTPAEASVASLAAEGLKDGGALSDDEVQRVSGAALAASDKVEGVDEEKTAALIAALTERLEKAEVMIGKLESKIADLEQKLYKIGKDARITIKDDHTLHGKIDDLQMR